MATFRNTISITSRRGNPRLPILMFAEPSLDSGSKVAMPRNTLALDIIKCEEERLVGQLFSLPGMGSAPRPVYTRDELVAAISSLTPRDVREHMGRLTTIGIHSSDTLVMQAARKKLAEVEDGASKP